MAVAVAMIANTIIAVASAICRVTPNLKIENLNVLRDQIRPQIENAIAFAIHIATAIAKLPNMKYCVMK